MDAEEKTGRVIVQDERWRVTYQAPGKNKNQNSECEGRENYANIIKSPSTSLSGKSVQSGKSVKSSRSFWG